MTVSKVYGQLWIDKFVSYLQGDKHGRILTWQYKACDIRHWVVAFESLGFLYNRLHRQKDGSDILSELTSQDIRAFQTYPVLVPRRAYP